jgi:hypothetical protein
MRSFWHLLPALGLATACTAPALAVDVKPLLETLQRVGPKGAGNREASEAWEQLAQAEAAKLPVILQALDNARPLSANWIRCAVDAIAERQLQRGGTLPQAELEQFVRDTRHAPRARRLAYEWLTSVDPTASARLIPGMLNDPSVEMRRDAVAGVISDAARAAQLGEPSDALPMYRRALQAARDLDQIRLLAGRLRDLGEEVDLARHLGFILRWRLIGPFDNTGTEGFRVAYPPEREIEPDAAYQGKHGEVKWVDYLSEEKGADQCGLVDFNKALGEEKAVVGYAMAAFISDAKREVELRLASDNAVKLWLNGTLLDQHSVYHAGFHMDQYTSRGTLKLGRNVILVKVCQNEQSQDWALGWSFRLRVCDATGGAVLSADRK